MSVGSVKPFPKPLPQTAEEFAVMSLEDLAALAFGNRRAGLLFLSTPHSRFGDQTLVEAARTDAGEAKVRQLLGSILFGLPA